MTLVYAVSIGLGTSATAVISRRIGEKDPELVSRSAWQAVITGAVISLLTGFPAIIFHKQLLVLMGLSPEVAETYGSYTLIITGSNLVIMLLFINNAIFRSSGDAAISMKVLWVANIINLILDPILIFGWGPIPSLGIMGAGIATTAGRGLAVAYQFYMLARGKHRISLHGSDMAPDWKIIFLGGIGLVLALIPGRFVGLFIADPEVFQYGSECLRILSLGFMAYGLGMVMVNALNGAGDTISPVWINIFCYWLLEVPLAYLLAITLDFREQGVYYSILAAEVLMTLSALAIFSRGKWKDRIV